MTVVNFSKDVSKAVNNDEADTQIFHPKKTIETKSTIHKLTRVYVEHELNLFMVLGRTSKPSDPFGDIRTYFNSTANKAAFACLVYANYYDGKPTTVGGAAHRCKMNRSSVSAILKYSLTKDWLELCGKREFQPTQHIINAWHDYVIGVVNDQKEFYRATSGLREAYLAETTDELPIK